MRPWLNILTILLLSTVTPLPASADNTELAKRYYKLGEQLYHQADYRQALVQFQESYKLSRRPALLFNMARCNESLGRHEVAIGLLKTYLRSAPPQADAIRVRLKNLEALVKQKRRPASQPAGQSHRPGRPGRR